MSGASGMCGVFGKLPAKRDFVASGLPQGVLGPWETWLQRELAQSRVRLDRGWTSAFLKAPLWRFWAGPRVLSREVIGVLMPSVDGVGRYFPLTLLAAPPEGRRFAAAGTLFSAPIFDALEARALAALEPGGTLEALIEGLRALDLPLDAAEEADAAALFLSAPLGEGEQALADFAGLAGPFARWQTLRSRGNVSLWWTLGGGGYSARVLALEGLPQDPLFATMLTGAFDEQAEPR